MRRILLYILFGILAFQMPTTPLLAQSSISQYNFPQSLEKYKNDVYKVDENGALTRKADALADYISIMDNKTGTLLICSDMFFTQNIRTELNSSVEHIVLQNVKSIPANAFEKYKGLKSVKIYGDNVVCSDDAFINCPLLERIYISGKHFVINNVTEKFSIYEEKAAKVFVEEKMQQWKVKGEFEKTLAWQERINGHEATEKENEFYNEYWHGKIASQPLPTLILGAYDIQHEVYPVECIEYDNFLLAVPKSEAKDFQDNWDKMRKNYQFAVKNKKLVIGNVQFSIQNKIYNYSADNYAENENTIRLHASNACSFIRIKNEVHTPELKYVNYVASSFSEFAQATMENWLWRSDFETIEEWSLRVSANTAQQKYEELYTSYCDNVIKAQDNVKINFRLGEYDADNEVFKIIPSKYQQFNLPVPIEKAPSFKEYWDKTQNKYTFIIDDRMYLNEVDFTVPDGDQFTYTYHSGDSLNGEYTMGINFENINFNTQDGVASIQNKLQDEKDNRISSLNEADLSNRKFQGLSDEIQTSSKANGNTHRLDIKDVAKYAAKEDAYIKRHPAVEAKYPGNWIQYLQTQLIYPAIAFECGAQGVVKIEFVVGKDGYITQCKIIGENLYIEEWIVDENGKRHKRYVGVPQYARNALIEEAIRVIKSSKWTPGCDENGNPMTSIKIQEINFYLM